MRDSFEVLHGDQFQYNEDGIDFIIDFYRVAGELQLFEIIPEPSDPIKGDGSLDGSDITYDRQVKQSYGPGIFYDTVPFEMLYSIHDKPQVKVTVDGIPAVCGKGVDCDFTFVEPASEVTDMMVLDETVTLTGIELPEDFSSSWVGSVTIAKTDCAVSVNSANEITCELSAPWVGGVWTPEI